MTEVTTAAFLNKGTPSQFQYVLDLYSDALGLKSEAKVGTNGTSTPSTTPNGSNNSNAKKEQALRALDKWMHSELPTILKSRGTKDCHLTHEELIQVIKWKQARGKFRPKLRELVTMNSPRVVLTETKKAFRVWFKKGDFGAAITYLTNLKGIGPSTASAILTALAPDTLAFMADEVLAAIPEIEGIDQTVLEYIEMMKVLNATMERLNEGMREAETQKWTPHRIELTLWAHTVLSERKPELLIEMPDAAQGTSTKNQPHPGDDDECSSEEVVGSSGVQHPGGEDSNSSSVVHPGEDSNSSSGVHHGGDGCEDSNSSSVHHEEDHGGEDSISSSFQPGSIHDQEDGPPNPKIIKLL